MDKPRILIIAPAWIGDLIISLAFINALKKIFKDSEIDLLVNENLVDIAKYFPDISNIITSLLFVVLQGSPINYLSVFPLVIKRFISYGFVIPPLQILTRLR